MIWRSVCTLGVLGLLVSFAEGQVAAPRTHGEEAQAAGLSSHALHRLDAALQAQVDEGEIAGAIGLISRHGTIGYWEAFGYRVTEEKLPMTKDTLFKIYSMTKPLVAVAAMSLWEEGRFKLDDSIGLHLDEWKTPKIRRAGKVVPANNAISPRHLMTHSAGLSYDRQGMRLARGMTLVEFSAALAQRPLQFEPGTDFVYGYGIDILGRYLEVLEGKSLDLIMRERVLDKMRMQDTEFWVRKAEDRQRQARVYRRSRSGELKPAMSRSQVMQKPTRMMGGAGLVSTAGDYARFCQMMLNQGQLDGQRVLKPATVKLMFQNHLEGIGKVYGLGGAVDGKGVYRWGGAAGTKFWIDSRRNAYSLFMIQVWDYRPSAHKIFRVYLHRAMAGDKG